MENIGGDASYPFPVGEISIFSEGVEGYCGVVHCDDIMIMRWRVVKERLDS